VIEAHRDRKRAIAAAFIAAGTWIGHGLLRLLGVDPTTRARRELEGMSDDLLRDMGISRSDIAYVVSHGRDEAEEQSGTTIIALPQRPPATTAPICPRSPDHGQAEQPALSAFIVRLARHHLAW